MLAKTVLFLKMKDGPTFESWVMTLGPEGPSISSSVGLSSDWSPAAHTRSLN